MEKTTQHPSSKTVCMGVYWKSTLSEKNIKQLRLIHYNNDCNMLEQQDNAINND